MKEDAKNPDVLFSRDLISEDGYTKMWIYG